MARSRRRINLVKRLAEAPEPLSEREALFVEYYCSNGFNASRAAQSAGYPGGSDGYFDSIGHRIKNLPRVQAAIQERLKQMAWDRDETTARLCAQAGASLDEFVKIVTDDEGKEHWEFDVVAAKKAGKLHLLKSLRVTDKGISFELVDSQGALDKIAKAQGLYADPEDKASKVIDSFEAMVRRMEQKK